MRKFRVKHLIALSVVICIVLIICLIFGFSFKGYLWKNHIKSEVDNFEQIKMVQSRYYVSTGTPYGGSGNNKTFVYYTIFESEQTQEELENSFENIVYRDNVEYQVSDYSSGWPTEIHVISLEQTEIGDNNILYGGINEPKVLADIESTIKEYNDEDLYIAMFTKVGRNYFFN